MSEQVEKGYTSVYVPVSLLQWFRDEAERQSRSFNSLIQYAMEQEKARVEGEVAEHIAA